MKQNFMGCDVTQLLHHQLSRITWYKNCLKIAQEMPKFSSTTKWHVFLAHSVHLIMHTNIVNSVCQTLLLLNDIEKLPF